MVTMIGQGRDDKDSYSALRCTGERRGKMIFMAIEEVRNNRREGCFHGHSKLLVGTERSRED